MEILDTKEELHTVSHVFAHQEHQKVVSQVEAFMEGKQDATAIYNTTPVVMGGTQGQVQIQVFVTCLVRWKDTLSNYKTFQNKLQLMNGQPLV